MASRRYLLERDRAAEQDVQPEAPRAAGSYPARLRRSKRLTIKIASGLSSADGLPSPRPGRPVILAAGMDRGTRARTRPSRSFGLELADRLAVSSDLIYLVWRHKLWWMLPLLLAMVVLAALVVLEATPIGPLLYPVF